MSPTDKMVAQKVALVEHLLPLLLKTQRFLDGDLARQQSFAALNIALLAEWGEVAQAYKPAWAWWVRKDKVFEYGDMLDEVADVMHFLLAIGAHGHADFGKRSGFLDDFKLQLEQYALLFDELVGAGVDVEEVWSDIARNVLSGVNFIGYGGMLAQLLALTRFDVDTLVRAYYRKAEKNLSRWGRDDDVGSLRTMRDAALSLIEQEKQWGLDK